MTLIPDEDKVKMYIYQSDRKGDWIVNYATCRTHVA